MNDINSVFLVGRLTRDEEVKHLANGTPIGSFSLAVNRSEKKGENWMDVPSFFDVTFFGKSAESLQKHLVKGAKVVINGRLKQDRWEKDGQKFSKVGIVAESVQPFEWHEGTKATQEFSDDIPF